jgi:hypothetical protein
MKRKVVSGRGKIVGVMRANGGWLFAVQAFSTSSKAVPVLVELRNAADLGGSARRKAERWLEYLS